MEKLFIMTVGTSLITGTFRLTRPQKDAVMDESLSPVPVTPAAQQVLNLYAEKLRDDHTPFLDTAEFWTMRAYQRTLHPDSDQRFTPGARYVFVVTDTYVARWVVQMFREIITTHYPTIRIETDIVVPGLTVGMPLAFDTAQMELNQHLNRLTDPYVAAGCADDVIFNASGGFKFISGWVHTYATMRGHRVLYLYEGSREILMTKPRIAGDFPAPLFI
ncbi:MAG: hypothetical protein ACKO83_03115 [Roseiflexaceae bacterium]